MAVFWDVAPCSLVDTERSFRGGYSFHHQGDAPLKRRTISTRLHGATAQKTAIFTLVAVRTWNVNYEKVLMLIFIPPSLDSGPEDKILPESVRECGTDTVQRSSRTSALCHGHRPTLKVSVQPNVTLSGGKNGGTFWYVG
jgi:hypothetical protein